MTSPPRDCDVLAVASQSSQTVAFFDANDYHCLDVVHLDGQPHELCFDAARRLLYCTHTYRSGHYHNNTGPAHEISVIDPDRGQVIDVIDLTPESAPHGLALDAERDLLYVSVEAGETAPGGLVIIDAATRRPVDRITTGAETPHWLAITTDARKAYVTNMGAAFVSVVDLLGRTWTGKIEVTGSAGVCIAPDGRYAYIATPHPQVSSAGVEKAIQVVETESDRIVRTIPMRHTVVGVHVTVDGKILASEVPFGEQGPENGWLNVFAPGNFELCARIEIGKMAFSISSAPNGAVSYVSSLGSNVVDVIDLTTFTSRARISTQDHGCTGPHGLVHIPAG